MINAFEGTFGVHQGQRRNHTKGLCAAGEFVGTTDAAALSRSLLFSGKKVPVIARFSLGGGDGMAPTNDPILLFRSPAYAVSFVKRRSGQ